MKNLLLLMLEQEPAGAVDDTLRLAGSARGKQNGKWSIKRLPVVLNRTRAERCDPFPDIDCRTHVRNRRRWFSQQYNLLNVACRCNGINASLDVKALAGIAVTGDR